LKRSPSRMSAACDRRHRGSPSARRGWRQTRHAASHRALRSKTPCQILSALQSKFDEFQSPPGGAVTALAPSRYRNLRPDPSPESRRFARAATLKRNAGQQSCLLDAGLRAVRKLLEMERLKFYAAAKQSTRYSSTKACCAPALPGAKRSYERHNFHEDARPDSIQ